jgi:hypothetical protein
MLSANGHTVFEQKASAPAVSARKPSAPKTSANAASAVTNTSSVSSWPMPTWRMSLKALLLTSALLPLVMTTGIQPALALSVTADGAALSEPNSTLPAPAPAIDHNGKPSPEGQNAQAAPPAAPASPAVPATPATPASPATPATPASPASPASPPTVSVDPDDGPSLPPSKGGTRTADDTAPVQIIRDLSTLPAPVRAMRDKLIEAATTGDISKLKPLVGTGRDRADIMNIDGDDPIETLKSFSGDPDGQEILAIMIDILSTGAARFDAGTPDETYVWPYFTGKSLAALTPQERVELLRIITAGDLMGMEDRDNYSFYRIGITPDGKWKFLSGGD